MAHDTIPLDAAQPDGVAFACPCYDVTGESFRALVRRGITDVAAIQRMTGAGLGCGACEGRMALVIRETVDAAFEDVRKEREAALGRSPGF